MLKKYELSITGKGMQQKVSNCFDHEAMEMYASNMIQSAFTGLKHLGKIMFQDFSGLRVEFDSYCPNTNIRYPEHSCFEISILPLEMLICPDSMPALTASLVDVPSRLRRLRRSFSFSSRLPQKILALFTTGTSSSSDIVSNICQAITEYLI